MTSYIQDKISEYVAIIQTRVLFVFSSLRRGVIARYVDILRRGVIARYVDILRRAVIARYVDILRKC